VLSFLQEPITTIIIAMAKALKNLNCFFMLIKFWF
jgi:hypothetical protein